MKRCAFKYATAVNYKTYMARDMVEAEAAGATLIPTYPWLCWKGSCPAIVDDYLVYADLDHLTLQFSGYLAPLVTDSILDQIKR